MERSFPDFGWNKYTSTVVGFGTTQDVLRIMKLKVLSELSVSYWARPQFSQTAPAVANSTEVTAFQLVFDYCEIWPIGFSSKDKQERDFSHLKSSYTLFLTLVSTWGSTSWAIARAEAVERTVFNSENIKYYFVGLSTKLGKYQVIILFPSCQLILLLQIFTASKWKVNSKLRGLTFLSTCMVTSSNILSHLEIIISLFTMQ